MFVKLNEEKRNLTELQVLIIEQSFLPITHETYNCVSFITIHVKPMTVTRKIFYHHFSITYYKSFYYILADIQ